MERMPPHGLGGRGIVGDATDISLTEDAIEVAVRSRLRAARIYSEDEYEAAWSYLYVNVTVIRRRLRHSGQVQKDVKDLATKLEFPATTWDTGSTGRHGKDPNFILSNVARHADKFIDEYLRVNADACK